MNVDIKQLNWWCPPEEYADIQDEWFIHFFKCGLSQFMYDDNATINIYTIFGSAECPNHSADNVVNFLFVGENQPGIMSTNHPAYPHFDAILTFFYDTPKSIRLPLWMIYWNFYSDGLFECPNDDDVTVRENRAIIIVSHDSTGLRNKYCEKVLHTHDIPVDSTLSSISHSKHIVPQKGRQFKNELIRKYKYNICPENSFAHGYITEKIFEAFANGCIPIYWGVLNPEPSIIKRNSFIHIDNEKEEDIQEHHHHVTDFWTPDAIVYIFASYLKIWSIVYHKLKMADKPLRKHADIIYYNCIDKDDCCTQLKHHWLQYKKFWSPRPIFKINNQSNYLYMEDLADTMYHKYKTTIGY